MQTVRFLTSREERRLPALLRIVRAGGRELSAAQLDGFFTGLALTPMALEAEEWLAALFGDRDIPFPSETDLRDLQEIVVRLRNRFRDRFRDDALAFPAAELAADRRATGDWCRGFLAALQLRPAWWMATAEPVPFTAEERRREGMSRFVVLQYFADPAKLDELAGYFAAREENLLALLPQLYLSLWRDSLKHLRQQAARAAVAAGPAAAGIGRNEPCPCGSGRKFKKCCGT
ncbi:MAG: UPF0149 family protein [Thermodesulfobacteriota bacterium]